jgi:uncharacterized membrane protein YeaQ/YmgE (transglycosylase-associated protein family)
MVNLKGGGDMDVTLGSVVIWVLIAALVGVIGELIARRHAPDGLIGAMIAGFIAIFLVVGVFHFSIVGEPRIAGVPLISSVIAAAILVAIWSALAYPYYRAYNRRGGWGWIRRRF